MKQMPRNSRWGFWTAVGRPGRSTSKPHGKRAVGFGRPVRSTAGYIKKETLSGRSTDKTREMGSSSRSTVGRPQGLSVDWPGRPIDLAVDRLLDPNSRVLSVDRQLNVSF